MFEGTDVFTATGTALERQEQNLAQTPGTPEDDVVRDVIEIPHTIFRFEDTTNNRVRTAINNFANSHADESFRWTERLTDAHRPGRQRILDGWDEVRETGSGDLEAAPFQNASRATTYS